MPTFLDKVRNAWSALREKNVGTMYPTITGGAEIFKTFGGEELWSKTKRLTAYKKSLYVFACVNKIAQKTSSIDWTLYKLSSIDGDKVEVPAHPIMDLLYRPNPFQTKEEFFMRFMINKKLVGEAFILKVRANGPGSEVVELWNLRPDFMTIILDAQYGIKAYEFSGQGKTTIFDPQDIIHDSYPDPLQEFGGMSPLQPATVRVDVEEFATKYQRNFFLNNARPDFIVMSDKKITAEQKEGIKESWDARHKSGRNQENVGKGAFLEGGLSYQQVSISQADMDYIEGLKMTRDDILVALGTPKPIVAITDDVNLANAETAMEIYMSETIVPEIRALTNKLNEHLVYEEFDPLLELEFENPIPDDDIQRATTQAQRITSGTLLINEAREEWGLDPIVGGNSLYMPIGMVPVGGIPSTAPADATKSMKRKLRPGEMSKNFRGRGRAYRILEKAKEIEETIYEGMAASLREAEEAETPKPTVIKYIKDEMTRKAYGDVTNNNIDAHAEAFVPHLNGFFEEQKKRALKALKLKKDKGMHMKLTGEEAAKRLKQWASDEIALATSFSFPFIDEFVKQGGADAMNLVAPAETFDDSTKTVQKYLKERSKQFGKETTSTTLDRLANTLGEGIGADEGVNQLVDRIDTVYNDFPLNRSLTIARTEATSANNKGFIESYRQSGVANAKEWIATSDSRTRETHLSLDGTTIELDGTFDNGCEFPGDPNADPGETVNCRCVIAPAFSE